MGKFLDINTEGKTTYYRARGKELQFRIGCIAGIGFMLFGYAQGVMGSLLTLPNFRETFPDIDTSKASATDHTATIQGVTVAIYEIGCMMGALFAMTFGDVLGRRRMVMIGSTIMCIGVILQCSSYSLGQLITGRVITGIGNGFNTATIPTWQSECIRASHRGKSVMVALAFNIFGVMLSYWIGFGFYFVPNNSVGWRFPIAFQCLLCVSVVILFIWVPESPRWLIKQDRIQDAKVIFAILEDTDPEDPAVLQKIAEVESLAAQEGEDKGFNLKAVFTNGENKHFHRAMLAAWSQAMQQLTGINLITYYAGTIYEKYIGMSPLNSRILAACNGTEYFIASCFAYLWIEKYGRRGLMLSCALGMSLTMVVLAACNWAAAYKDDKASSYVAAVCLFVFNSFFAVGWLGVPWLYPAEISPLEVRAPINGISTATNWSFNFMVVMVTPVSFESIGYKTYIIFAVLNMALVPVVYFMYPETAGRSLEDMDKVFQQSNLKTPWDVVKIERNMPREEVLSTNK